MDLALEADRVDDGADIVDDDIVQDLEFAGVAIDVLHLGGVEPEPLVEDLLEHGLVALALVLAAHQQHRVAAGMKADLGKFLARPGRLLDRIGEADAAELAAALRVLAALRKP